MMKHFPLFLLILFILTTTFSFAMDNEEEETASTCLPVVNPALRETYKIARAWHEYNESWLRYMTTGLWHEKSGETPDFEEERLDLFFSKAFEGPKIRKYAPDAKKRFSFKEVLESCQNDYNSSDSFLKSLTVQQQENLPDALYFLCAARLERLRLGSGACSDEFELKWIRLLRNSLEPLASKIVVTFGENLECVVVSEQLNFDLSRSFKSLGCPLDKILETRLISNCQKWCANFQREHTSHDALCPLFQHFEQTRALSSMIGLVIRRATGLRDTLSRLFLQPNILKEPSLFIDRYSEENLSVLFRGMGELHDIYESWKTPVIPKNEFCCLERKKVLGMEREKEMEELKRRLQKKQQPKGRGPKERLPASSRSEEVLPPVIMEQVTQIPSSIGVSVDEVQAAFSTKPLEKERPLVAEASPIATPTAVLEKVEHPSTTILESVEMVTRSGMADYKTFLAQFHRDFKENLEIQSAGAPTIIKVNLPHQSAIVAFDPPHGKAAEKQWPQWRCQCKKLFQKLGLME